MAIEDLDLLREKLPDLFDDGRVNSDVLEDSFVAPVDAPPEELGPWIDSMIEESVSAIADDMIPVWVGGFGSDLAIAPPTGRRKDPLSKIGKGEFPGKYRPPDDWFPGQPIPPLAPDALAFYVPFHYSQPYWGIYVVLENYVVFCTYLYQKALPRVPGLTPAIVRKAVDGFLYAHEQYHHKVECFATRLEVISRVKLYRKAFEALYKQRIAHPDSIEEGLATAAGLLEAKQRLEANATAQAELCRLLEDHVRLLPPEYGEGLKLLQPAHFESREQDFSEANHGTCFPALARKMGRLPEIWGAFTFANRGFLQINSPFSYIVPRASSLTARLPHSLRALTARNLRKKITVLGQCSLLRQGGRHEVWVCKKTGNEVAIPMHPGDLKPGTLASIAKDACGLSLHDFLRAEA